MVSESMGGVGTRSSGISLGKDEGHSFFCTRAIAENSRGMLQAHKKPVRILLHHLGSKLQALIFSFLFFFFF